MIPLIVLRRLDCVLEDTKAGVVEEVVRLQARKYDAATVESIIKQKFKVPFFNTSKYTFRTLLGDPNQLATNLPHYLKSFSKEARDSWSISSLKRKSKNSTRPTCCSR